VYELEDDIYITTSEYRYIDDDGVSHRVEDHYSNYDDITLGLDSDDKYVVVNGVKYEIETEDEALAEDQTLIRLYQAVFDREPDEGGYEFWAKSLDSTDNFDSILEKFTQSEEFQSIYSELDNAGFLTELYMNVLGREGDEGGFAYWLTNLDSGAVTTTYTVLFFAESEEFISDTFDSVQTFIETVGQHSITEDMLIL
jgi:hypothetical protein